MRPSRYLCKRRSSDQVPDLLRHAVEVRHPSFVNPAFIDLLKRHGIALVVADTAGRWPKILEVTADFVYVRLHGDKQIYTSGYTSRALDLWAARIREWHRRADVYVYFDNDVKVRAPYDALALMRKLGLGPQAPPLPKVPRHVLRSPRSLGPRARAAGEDPRWRFSRGASRPRSGARTGGTPARR